MVSRSPFAVNIYTLLDGTRAGHLLQITTYMHRSHHPVQFWSALIVACVLHAAQHKCNATHLLICSISGRGSLLLSSGLSLAGGLSTWFESRLVSLGLAG